MANQDFRVKNGLQVGVGGTILKTIANGNIGINSTQPTSKLDVNGDVDVAGTLDVDGHTELDNVNVSGAITATTFTGNLAGTVNTAAQPNITSVGTLGALTVSGVSTFGNNVRIEGTSEEETTLTFRHTGVANNVNAINFEATSGSGVSTSRILFDWFGSEYGQSHGLNYVSGRASFANHFFRNDEGNIQLSIRDNGNVSIGDHTPTAKLDVDGTLNVSGISTFQDDIHLGDGDKINLGDNDDFQIFHHSNGTGIIQNAGSGQLQIRSDEIRLLNQATDEDYAFFRDDGAVELYYDNSKKFETIGIGISVLNGSGDTATIAGPANLIIDPGVVGDNTGTVRIKGDLIIDGVETKVNSTTVEIADKVIGIATTCTSDLLTDGAGIGIGSNKTFLYEHNSGTNPSLKSSENLNVPTGKGYQVNQTEVLNATTLGSNVVNSSLTNVGTLTELDVNVSGVSTLGTVKISSGIVTAVSGVVTYYGDGSNLTGTDIPGISTTGTSTFNNIKVSGVSTFMGSMTLQNNQSFDFGGTGRRVTSSGTALILATDAANDIKISANAYGSNQSDVEIRTGSDGGKVYVTGTGGVGIYHTDTALKLETTGYGVSVTGDLNTSGISSAAAFANFDYLQAPFGSTVTFTVTVASKDASHRYNGTGSGNGYLINGVQAPFLTLTPGRTYRFTNDNTGSHPLKFYLEADKTTEYTSGVNFQNTYTEITVGDETPVVLHYQCTAHGYMGNAIQVNSNVVNTNYDAVLRGGLNVSGVSTFVGVSTFQDTIVLTGVGKSLNIGPGDSKLQLLYDSNTGQIVHDATLFLTAADGITFLDDTQTREIANFYANGSIELCHSTHNTSDVKFQTTSTGVQVTGEVVSGGLNVIGHAETDTLNVSGISSFNDDTYFHGTLGQELFWDKSENILDFAVNASAAFGNSNQLKVSGGVNGGTIELSGTSPTSGLFIKKGTTESIADFIIDGAVDLYYDNSKKFETTGIGVSIYNDLNVGTGVTIYGNSGIVSVTAFYGDGSNLSGITTDGFSPDTDENLVAGTDAGANLDGLNGCFNVFLGSCAGKEVTSGDSNVFLGTKSGRSLTTGQCNISLGTCAGIGITSGSNNIMMGIDTGCCTKSGNNNIIFGQHAGKYQYNTDNNIFIGKCAGRSSSTVTNNTGGSNIAMGGSSGYNLAGGFQNIFMGYYSGYCASTGKMNLALGYRAGERLEGGCSNVFIGNSAGICHREGYDNISIGSSAGRGSNNPTSNTGSYNIYLGAESGRDNTIGSENVFIGRGAGNKNADGDYNIMIGCCAGDSATNSMYSIFLGGYAGRNLVSGSGNIAIGFGVSFPSTTDNYQTAIGFGTSYSLYSTGVYSTLETTIANKLKVNCSSGIVTATSGNLIYYGDGSKLTGINAGGGGASNINSLSDGYSAGLSVGLGTGALANDDGADRGNVAVGYSALNANISGFWNVAIGRDAMGISTNASANVYIGRQAGRVITTSSQNVVIGDGAGYSQTSSSFSVLIGRGAGAQLTDAGSQTLVGYSAGGSGSITNSTAVGFNAGDNSDSDKSTYIGYMSGYWHSGDQNTFVGHRSGESDYGANVGTGNSNTGIGYLSLNNLTSGSKNTSLGHNTGVGITNGSNNILIGYNVDTSSPSASNEVVIGDSNITKFSVPGIGVTLKDNGGTPTQGHVLTVDANGEASFAAPSGAGFTPDSQYNLYAGTSAGAASDADTCFNVGIGYEALKSVNEGDNNVAIGPKAGMSQTSGYGLIAIGCCAGAENEIGNVNIALGYYSLSSVVSGNCNIALGFAAGSSVTGDYAVFIGANAGKCATTVKHSIGVGEESLRGSNSVCNTGCYNIALGCGSGRNIQTGSCNIFLGTFAGYNHTTGIRNTFLGHDSGKSDNFGAGTGNCNTAVGDSSMCNIRGGHSNTAIGHNAGRDTTDGFCNVFLGVCAGNNVSTGSCNIAIGPNVRLDSITGNCQFAIGVGTDRWITGDSNFNIYDKDGNQLNGSGGGGITVQDEGSSLSTTATTLNFVGAGVTASGSGATKTISIDGGSGGGGTVSSGNFTASAGSPSTLNTYAYDSAELVFEYTVFVKNGSDYQTQKLLVMRDGTTVDSTQYAVMYSNGLLVQLDATISGSNLLLRATPETGVNGSTTYRLKREAV